jgi:RecB family endonuclease NucS
MYRINEESNEIERVEAKSFSELGYHERENLQEWIAKNPYVFGEDLLIVQKEFNGFADTNERLDLLALDKAGNTVVIENKLDDSGRDVVWQALKYASYCSQLTKANIRDIYQDYLKTTGATVPGRSNATASTSTATWLSIASSCRKKTGTRRR